MSSSIPLPSTSHCRAASQKTLDIKIQREGEPSLWRPKPSPFFLQHMEWELFICQLKNSLIVGITGLSDLSEWSCTASIFIRIVPRSSLPDSIPANYHGSKVIVCHNYEQTRDRRLCFLPIPIELEKMLKESLLSEQGQLHLEVTVKVEVPPSLACPIPERRASLLNSPSQPGIEGPVDLLIVTEEGSERRAHRAVLIAHSVVFTAMFGNGMRESLEGRIHMEDVSSGCLDILLKFLYEGPALAVKDIEAASSELLQDLIYVSEKYGMEELKELAALELLRWLTVENAYDTLRFVKRFRISGETVKEFRAFVWENIKEVFETL